MKLLLLFYLAWAGVTAGPMSFGTKNTHLFYPNLNYVNNPTPQLTPLSEFTEVDRVLVSQK
jgi:hypothetical protein